MRKHQFNDRTQMEIKVAKKTNKPKKTKYILQLVTVFAAFQAPSLQKYTVSL